MERTGRRRILGAAAPHRSVRGALAAAAGAALVMGLATVPAQAQRTTATADAAPVAVAPAALAGEDAADINVLVFHGAAGQAGRPRGGRDHGPSGSWARSTGSPCAPPATRAAFTAKNLATYRGVVFLSAEGVDAQHRAGGRAAGLRAGRRRLPRHPRRRTGPGRTRSGSPGLIGTRPVGSLPDPLAVASVTASAENPPNETPRS